MGSNWGFIIFRTALFSVILFTLYFSQRFWFVRAWRLISRMRRPVGRRLLRGAWVAAGLLLFLSVVDSIAGAGANHHLFARSTWFTGFSGLQALAGLWLFSALLAVVGLKLVRGVEWLWLRLKPRRSRSELAAACNPAQPASLDVPPNPERRYFFQTASYLAAAVPFAGALYGFAAERLRYKLHSVEVPLENLPAALDGLRIAQLSDIHCGGYMPREQVRRAVEMANDLSAELAVVTGDFITGSSDPIEDCITELARLRAPLGVWGCNGNHEIYADAEDYAAELFRRHGMRLLRHHNAPLLWRGAALNLIGVDYQRERSPSGRRLPKLMGIEPLVRRDAPNILLSHNPNAFPRAAELGIELTLSGHTHGGQVQVEILDHRWNPARFITDFVAGLYRRPLGALPGTPVSPAPLAAQASNLHAPTVGFLYVNRGLGTIGAPVRFNVPPEITLLTLRRA